MHHKPKKTPSGKVLTLLLLGAALICGCGDDTFNDTVSVTPVNPERIAQDLTKSTWEWKVYTAAWCREEHRTWTFHPDTTFKRYTYDNSYPDDAITQDCLSNSNTRLGSFRVDEEGVAHLSFDGEETYAWQVGIFAAAPSLENREKDPTYTLVHDIITTHAYAAHPNDAQVFTQYIKEPRPHGQHVARTTTLTFDDPLTIGACRLTVSMTATSVSNDAPEIEARHTFDANCRVEATGLDGWLAINLLEEVEFEDSSNPTAAESSLSSARWDYQHKDSLLFYYHDDAPRRLLIHPYRLTDDRWMKAR